MSSPAFSSALLTVQSSLVKIGEAYLSDYTDAYKRAVELGIKLAKYPEYISQAAIDDFENTSWTDTVDQATQIVDALGNSPVMQEIYNQIEAEFGISIRSPIALAQNIMQGRDSNLLKVVIALLYFDVKMRALSSAGWTIYNTMKGINDYLVDHPGLAGTLNPEAAIPAEIVTRLETARNELQRTLGTPFDVRKYDDVTTEIREIADAMGDIPVFNNAVDALGNIAIKMMLDSAASTVNMAYRLITKAGDECRKNITTITTTDTTIKGANNKRFVMAKKAVRRINDILGQMRRGDVQQGLQLPKYIVALNVAYSILRTGRPYNDTSITLDVMDVSGITVSTAQIDAITNSCRKLLRATQVPRKLVAIKDEIATLYSALTVFDAAIDDSVDAIEDLQGVYHVAFDVAQSALLFLDGLDMAQSLLVNGNYEDFFSVTEANSTSEAAAIQSLNLLADLCDRVGLWSVSGSFRKRAKDMERNEREKRCRREIKKEKKKSRLAAEVESLSKMMEDIQELLATSQGVIEGILAVIN